MLVLHFRQISYAKLDTMVFAVYHLEVNKILARLWWYRKAITWRLVSGCVKSMNGDPRKISSTRNLHV